MTTEFDAAAAAERKLRALQALPAHVRHVFVLHRFEEWPFSEIAGHLKMTPEQVEGAFAEAMSAIVSA